MAETVAKSFQFNYNIKRSVNNTISDVLFPIHYLLLAKISVNNINSENVLKSVLESVLLALI